MEISPILETNQDNMSSNIKIFITDDHQIMIDGLIAMFQDEADFKIVGSASNGIETLKKLESTDCNVLLLDLVMPRMDGIETTKHVVKRYPNIKILVLTTNDEGSIITTLFKYGVTGFLPKISSKEVLIESVRKAARGEKVLSGDLTAKMLESLQNPKKKIQKGVPKLTKREKDVLLLIMEEKTTQEIASQLFISANTVITHRRNLLVKFDVKNSVGLAKKALEMGLV